MSLHMRLSADVREDIFIWQGAMCVARSICFAVWVSLFSHIIVITRRNSFIDVSNYFRATLIFLGILNTGQIREKKGGMCDCPDIHKDTG